MSKSRLSIKIGSAHAVQEIRIDINLNNNSRNGFKNSFFYYPRVSKNWHARSIGVPWLY